ncbi:hypothetical protein DVH24_029559 [Malus domestica]|uniref:Uncharacterized protein n=1 Tax=Malus domestica TaxID=3750 RepID=A0A498HTD8_MALDO|nr:hypothetical protein DVH24_029559 [Malus domestica]
MHQRRVGIRCSAGPGIPYPYRLVLHLGRATDYRRQSCEPRLTNLYSGLKRTLKPKGLVFGPKIMDLSKKHDYKL